MTTASVGTRLDAATWALLLEGYESSDLSIKDYCLSRGISAASFYQWRKRLDENKETAKTLFRAIELSSKPTGGVIVELPGGISLLPRTPRPPVPIIFTVHLTSMIFCGGQSAP